MKSASLAWLALFLASLLRATTVIPPSFAELVASSELIFRGHVTAVTCVWTGNGGDRHIATQVTFAVEQTLRGSAAETLVLEFFGGTIGDKQMLPAGWPRFAVGDRGIFFVENRAGRICPLVRLRHGRYRIVSDHGTERLVRDNLRPLHQIADVSLPLDDTASLSGLDPAPTALSVSAFEQEIVAASSTPAGRLPIQR